MLQVLHVIFKDTNFQVHSYRARQQATIIEVQTIKMDL